MWGVGVEDSAGALVDLVPAYTCRLYLPDDGIDQPVTDKNGNNDRFEVQLSPLETGALSIGTHRVAIEIVNADINPQPFTRTVRLTINVEDQWE